MNTKYIVLPALILALAGCSNHDQSKLINKEASLPSSFQFNKMGLKVINSSINKKKETMSTLYGNDLALQSFKSNTPHTSGEVLALVTWKQKEDEHWFGAKIPGPLLAVELVKTANSGETTNPEIGYERFEGSSLTLNKDTTGRSKSIAIIFNQKPSILP